MTDFTLNQYLILLSRTLQGTQLGANLGTAVTLCSYPQSCWEQHSLENPCVFHTDSLHDYLSNCINKHLFTYLFLYHNIS